MRSRHKVGIAVFAIMLAILLPSVLAAPSGMDINAGPATTKGFFGAGLIGAQGGNATSLNASVETQTLAWQGFYGEVIGNVTLRDMNGNQIYSWEQLIENGTVFASRDSNVDFTNITAQNDCTIDEDLTGTGSDRVNKTFTPSNNTEFRIGTSIIVAGTACTAHTYVNNASQSIDFEEIILTDNGGQTSIFATKIENDATGFDGGQHDWQMIVPEYRNETLSTYYFYAELK